MPRTRRKTTEKQSVISNTGIEVSENWCRKCRTMKPIKEYYQAVDTYLDACGYMSVCKDCINDIYNRVLQNEHTIEKTILRMCRMLNIKYDEEAVHALKAHIESFEKKGSSVSSPFGVYKSKLAAVQKTEIAQRGKGDTVDLTFREPMKPIISSELDPEDDETAELVDTWGDGLDYSDYVFLEKKFAEWKQSYSCKGKSEEFYLREACFKELELKRARTLGQDVGSILKSMNDLLKNAALTPAQATVSSDGNATQLIGNIIKRMEREDPAEYYQNKKLYEDYDNIGQYISNYIKRPILNFLSGNKNFEILEDNDVSIDMESDLEDV